MCDKSCAALYSDALSALPLAKSQTHSASGMFSSAVEEDDRKRAFAKQKREKHARSLETLWFRGGVGH